MHGDQEGACNARGEESNGIVTNSVTQGRQLSLAGSLDCSPGISQALCTYKSYYIPGLRQDSGSTQGKVHNMES